MRRIVQTIGLILLGAFPVQVSAQIASDPPPTATGNNIALVAYQQPAAEPRNTNIDPLPLPPKSPTDRAEASKGPTGLQSAVTVVGSLAAVLGVFFLIVWLLRRASPHRAGMLPAEVFEVLGRAPLANHQQVHLLRCGTKLLLVAVGAAGGGMTTLTEITDPAEVDLLTAACRQTKAAAPAASFRRVFRQAEEHRA